MKGLKPGRPGKARWGIPGDGLLPCPKDGKFGTWKLLSFGTSLFSLGSIGVMAPGPGMGTGVTGPGCVLPSCCDILRLTCGVCSFGFGFAECLFLLLLLLNIMVHPCTLHLCISRKWTAEKWIFRAPLSQNVFMQTLHWTRFLPVELTYVIPMSSGNGVLLGLSSIELRRLPESLSISLCSLSLSFSWRVRLRAPLKCSFAASLAGLLFGLGSEPGIPGKGNTGKWFDMRFDIDMVEGGRGIPLDILWGKIGEAWVGTASADEAIEVTGDGCFGGGVEDSTTSLLGDLTTSLSSLFGLSDWVASCKRDSFLTSGLLLPGLVTELSSWLLAILSWKSGRVWSRKGLKERSAKSWMISCCVIVRVSRNMRNCLSMMGSSSFVHIFHRSRGLPLASCNKELWLKWNNVKNV